MIDTQPVTLSDDQIRWLSTLCNQVMFLMEQRRALKEVQALLARFSQIDEAGQPVVA
ncbi:MAG: hypothetical protein ACOYNL_04460 [Rickettsiales bacterium]